MKDMNWGQAVHLLWWPSLMKDMKIEQLLCLSVLIDKACKWFERRTST